MKSKIKISRARIAIILLFIGIIILVEYARSDMNLNIDLLRESVSKMPGMMMQNIQLSRKLSGDIWRVKIPYLDREGSTVNMRSLDVVREISGDKGEWYFFGRSGVYSFDQQIASVNGLLGTLQTETRTWNLESPKLNWKQDNNTFTFPEGFVIYDDEFLLRTPKASMDNSGVILLEQGGVIQWVRRIEDY